jgi:hypothetical protein
VDSWSKQLFLGLMYAFYAPQRLASSGLEGLRQYGVVCRVIRRATAGPGARVSPSSNVAICRSSLLIKKV